MKTRVITHRGLDPSIPGFPSESTREAFQSHIGRGFGLEFDIRLSRDGVMIATHDPNLKRITGGRDERVISDIDSAELLAMDFGGYHLITIPELLDAIEAGPANTVSAIHLKIGSQTKESLDKLLAALEGHNTDRYMLFDATIETAEYLKDANPDLVLAASVSHPHDIAQYNSVVGGTLYTIEQIIEHPNLFDVAWLDEWDLTDADGEQKELLSEETFFTLREAGISIALVTPELHGTSPGLLGGEAHPDATPHETRWKERMQKILALEPDFVCTDYPDEVMAMNQKING